MNGLIEKASQLGGSVYKASLVKYLTPGHIVLDVDLDYHPLWREVGEMKEIVKKLTEYWKVHHNDPIEGRKFLCGEVVAVELGVWRPGLITNFRYKDGMHFYELVLLDCGQIVEVHRMSFRHIPQHVPLYCRYTYFYLLDILPIEARDRRFATWSVAACENLKNLFMIAKDIYIIVLAKQHVECYTQLYGNMYLHINNEMIDVKERLLGDNEAFEDNYKFRKTYGLKNEDMVYEEQKEAAEQRSKRDFVPVEVEDIGDGALDEYLPDAWKTGGSDPLPQVERESIRRRLISESHIRFADPRASESTAPTSLRSTVPTSLRSTAPTSLRSTAPTSLRSTARPSLQSTIPTSLEKVRREFKREVPNVEFTTKSAEHNNVSSSTSFFQQKLLTESNITFSRPQNHDKGTKVNEDQKTEGTEKQQNLGARKKSVTFHLTKDETKKVSTQSEILFNKSSINSNNKAKQLKPNSSLQISKKSNMLGETYVNLPEIQVASGELSLKLAKLFVGPGSGTSPHNDTQNFSLKNGPSNEQQTENKWKTKEEPVLYTCTNSNESNESHSENVQVATGQLSKMLSKLFSSQDQN